MGSVFSFHINIKQEVYGPEDTHLSKMVTAIGPYLQMAMHHFSNKMQQQLIETQCITVQWPNRKRPESVHPNNQ